MLVAQASNRALGIGEGQPTELGIRPEEERSREWIVGVLSESGKTARSRGTPPTSIGERECFCIPEPALGSHSPQDRSWSPPSISAVRATVRWCPWMSLAIGSDSCVFPG